MTEKTEMVSVRVPKKWRDVAEENWVYEGIDFNYSAVIRAALHDYLIQRKWMDRDWETSLIIPGQC